MNKVKFVPADPKVRALSKPEVLVINVTQTKQCFFHKKMFKLVTRIRPPCLREAETMANRRGWTRLAFLPKAERRRYVGAKEVRG